MTEPPDPTPVPTEPPAPPFTSERQDGSILEQWDIPSRTYRRYDCGLLIEERPFTDAENASADAAIAADRRRINQATLVQRARTAIASNQSYLDKVTAGTATNADHIAQVPQLTRQMQGVIRLLVGSDLLDQT